MFKLTCRQQPIFISRHYSRRHWCRHVSFEPIVALTSSYLHGLHSATGLPWAAVIPIAAITLRGAVTLPFSLIARRRIKRLQEIRPLFGAWSHVYRKQIFRHYKGQITPDEWERKVIAQSLEKRKCLMRKYKCNPLYTFAFPMIQLPVFMGMSTTLRSMSGWGGFGTTFHEPQLAHEGIWWFQSLIEPDPLYVLPLVFGFVTLVNLEMQANLPRETRSRMQLILSNVGRVGTAALVCIAVNAPAGLSLYWLTSAFFSQLQNRLLESWIPLTSTSQGSR